MTCLASLYIGFDFLASIYQGDVTAKVSCALWSYRLGVGDADSDKTWYSWRT